MLFSGTCIFCALQIPSSIWLLTAGQSFAEGGVLVTNQLRAINPFVRLCQGVTCLSRWASQFSVLLITINECRVSSVNIAGWTRFPFICASLTRSKKSPPSSVHWVSVALPSSVFGGRVKTLKKYCSLVYLTTSNRPGDTHCLCSILSVHPHICPFMSPPTLHPIWSWMSPRPLHTAYTANTQQTTERLHTEELLTG